MRHFFDPVDKVPPPEEETENTQGKLNVFVLTVKKLESNISGRLICNVILGSSPAPCQGSAPGIEKHTS